MYKKCLESTAYRLIITEAPHDQGKGRDHLRKPVGSK